MAGTKFRRSVGRAPLGGSLVLREPSKDLDRPPSSCGNSAAGRLQAQADVGRRRQSFVVEHRFGAIREPVGRTLRPNLETEKVPIFPETMEGIHAKVEST